MASEFLPNLWPSTSSSSSGTRTVTPSRRYVANRAPSLAYTQAASTEGMASIVCNTSRASSGSVNEMDDLQLSPTIWAWVVRSRTIARRRAVHSHAMKTAPARNNALTDTTVMTPISLRFRDSLRMNDAIAPAAGPVRAVPLVVLIVSFLQLVMLDDPDRQSQHAGAGLQPCARAGR